MGAAVSASIPRRLVILGRALDLHLLADGKKARLGWTSKHLLCSDLGRRRLFIVPERSAKASAPKSARARDVYRAWSGDEAREDLRTSVRLAAPVYRGRCAAVAYRSDKWGRAPTDYQHDFITPPRITQIGEVYRIAGGDLRVTERGITG